MGISVHDKPKDGRLVSAGVGTRALVCIAEAIGMHTGEGAIMGHGGHGKNGAERIQASGPGLDSAPFLTK